MPVPAGRVHEGRDRQARMARLREVLKPYAPQPGMPVPERRKLDEELAARVPLPAGVEVNPSTLGGVPCEWLSPAGTVPGRTVLYLHGGGYAYGSVVTVRPMASAVAQAAGLRTVTLDYRRAPEHPHPAALDDAVAAYLALLRTLAPAHVAVAGDSAGGGLALALLVALRDAGHPLPAAAAVLSPWVDLTLSAPSLSRAADDDPLVTPEHLRELAALYVAGRDAALPLASPLFADLRGLPPLLVHVGGAEKLLDDGRRLAEAAAAAGVDVDLEVWDEMVHVWHAYAPKLPEAVEAVRRVGGWLRSRVL